MFFTEMAAMLASSGKEAKLNIMMGQTESGQLSLVVIPQASGGKDAQTALTRPLTIVATPAELDEGFVEAISQYTAARTTLAEQLEAEATIMRAETEASAKRSADKLKGKKETVKASGASGSPGPAAPDEEADEDPSGDTSCVAAPAQVPQSEAAASGGLKLFG